MKRIYENYKNMGQKRGLHNMIIHEQHMNNKHAPLSPIINFFLYNSYVSVEITVVASTIYVII